MDAFDALAAQKELLAVMETCLTTLRDEKADLEKKNKLLDKKLNAATQALEDRTSELKAAHKFIAVLKQKLERHKAANTEWQRQNMRLQQQLANRPQPSQVPSEDEIEIPTSQTEIIPLSQPLLQQSIGFTEPGPIWAGEHVDNQPHLSEPQLSQPQLSQPQLSQPQSSQPHSSEPQSSQPEPKVELSSQPEPQNSQPEPNNLAEPDKLAQLLTREWHPQDFVHNEHFDPNTFDASRAAEVRFAIETLAKTRAQAHNTPPGFWTSGLRFAENTQAERAVLANARKEDALSRLVEALTPGGRYLFRDQTLRQP